MNIEKIEKLSEYIKESNHCVVLTGAGISTSAGIPDFRGEKGIYTLKKYDPYKTFNYGYFLKNPSYFFDFAKEFLTLYKEIEPTRMHKLLAEMEKRGYVKTIITQNIDGLHQKAGSKNVIEIHGTMTRGYCLKCGEEYNFEQMAEMLIKKSKMECDRCGGLVKPDIVFFGEQVKDLFLAEEESYNSDLFIVIGSSLAVFPAASLPFLSSGKRVIINKGPLDARRERFDLLIEEDIESVAETLAELLDLTLTD